MLVRKEFYCKLCFPLWSEILWHLSCLDLYADVTVWGELGGPWNRILWITWTQIIHQFITEFILKNNKKNLTFFSQSFNFFQKKKSPLSKTTPCPQSQMKIYSAFCRNIMKFVVPPNYTFTFKYKTFSDGKKGRIQLITSGFLQTWANLWLKTDWTL